MKKVLSIIMAIVLSVAVLAACGNGSDSGSGSGSDSGSASSETVSVESLKTFGDIRALESEENQVAVYDGKVIHAFKLGDTYYRATGTISPEDEKAYMDIDFMDSDYEEKQQNILAPIEIGQIENLSEQMLSQEELDALVGKTGQELQDAGWTFSGHTLETMEFWMNYGPFLYTVTFDGQVAEADYESFIDEEGTKTMTVKSAVFNSMGDAAY